MIILVILSLVVAVFAMAVFNEARGKKVRYRF